jgi:hypothetical protein
MSQKAAMVAETNEESVTFTHNRRKYTVPAPSTWPVDIQEAIEDQRFVTATRLILGKDQWAKYKEAEKPTLADLRGLLNTLFDALGTDLGESEG